MEFLQGIIRRLGIATNWMGFICFALCCCVPIWFLGFGVMRDEVSSLLLIPVGFVLWVIAWTMKFVLTGEKSFLPWN